MNRQEKESTVATQLYTMLHKNMMYFIILFYFVSLSAFEYSDLAGRVEFPPKIDADTSPIGHKKPLGNQRAPEAPIKEYTKHLHPDTFWESHVKPLIPLVYRGGIKDSLAILLWNDEYLAQHYGDLDVLVEHKKEDRTSSSGRMVLSDFLKYYKNDDLYVVSMFPTEMMHQVRAINSIICGTFKNYTHESNVWISAGGTRSVVHYDADHNLHCLIDGRKDFIMIENNLKSKTNLYFKQKDPRFGSGYSFLDPDNIDMKKFPKIAKVPWTWASLYPGDCIFIPSKYIHQVRGYGRTVAVTTLFTADVQDNFNSDDCTDELMATNYTMSDIDFLWTYKKGDATIDMGYMNTELVKKELLRELTDEHSQFAKYGKMNMRQFIYFTSLSSPSANVNKQIKMTWKNDFGMSENEYLDVEKVNGLTLDQLKKYCRIIEQPHGVVTNGSEPVFVRPGERHNWEKETQHESKEKGNEEVSLRKIASRDPMFDYLSEEEQKEYIRKKTEEKQKYGLKYKMSDEYIDRESLSEEKRILMDLSWRFDDIPDKYKRDVANGNIPKEFHDEFVDALPESIRSRYKEYFVKHRIPNIMLKALFSFTTYEVMEATLKRLQKEEEKGKANIMKDEF